jgi:hypothetical protein
VAERFTDTQLPTPELFDIGGATVFEVNPPALQVIPGEIGDFAFENFDREPILERFPRVPLDGSFWFCGPAQ